MATVEVREDEQRQRVQVEMETRALGKSVKIRVESYDDCLRWYTAGALTLPLHQLPLLEQAVEAMLSVQASQGDGACKVIPFPAVEAA